MLRLGEAKKKNIKYEHRPGIYGLILVGTKILLTEQDGNEVQLPGGGLNFSEHSLQALHREVCEETGWKIETKKRLGFFQRFVFMPEYNKWAQKISHICLCKGIYKINKPSEPGHIAFLEEPIIAAKMVESPGDSYFIKKFLC